MPAPQLRLAAKFACG